MLMMFTTNIGNARMSCITQASDIASFRRSLQCCMFTASVCYSSSSSFCSLLIIGLSDTWILSVYSRSWVSSKATECVHSSPFANTKFCHSCQQLFCCPSKHPCRSREAAWAKLSAVSLLIRTLAMMFVYQ